MLVSATEMLKKAKAGHYAVGQFNINNLEWTKAILQTAQECNSPVILGVSEGAGKYMTGYKTVVGMVNGMLEELNITVPVALHLDHGNRKFGKGCAAMLRKLNCFLNIVIGSSIGVFIGFGIYKFWHFKTYPNLYAIQSAPWYTELLLDGALVAVVVVVCIILKLIIRKNSKP